LIPRSSSQTSFADSTCSGSSNGKSDHEEEQVLQEQRRPSILSARGNAESTVAGPICDCEPASDFNGTWILTTAAAGGKKTHRVHGWLKRLHIQGDLVCTGEGDYVTLKRRDGKTWLENGAIAVEGDMLLRVGSSGSVIAYRRATYDEELEMAAFMNDEWPA